MYHFKLVKSFAETVFLDTFYFKPKFFVERSGVL